MSDSISNYPCEGKQCPAATNCRRYTDWTTFDGQPAAFWARREAGADSCESMVPVQVLTRNRNDRHRKEGTELDG